MIRSYLDRQQVLVSSISHSISVVLVDGLKSGNVDTGDSEIGNVSSYSQMSEFCRRVGV